jgi:hypothetical protein
MKEAKVYNYYLPANACLQVTAYSRKQAAAQRWENEHG